MNPDPLLLVGAGVNFGYPSPLHAVGARFNNCLVGSNSEAVQHQGYSASSPVPSQASTWLSSNRPQCLLVFVALRELQRKGNEL